VSGPDPDGMEAPGGVEPPTNGLGNRCSIQLSYGAISFKARELVRKANAASVKGSPDLNASFAFLTGVLSVREVRSALERAQ
jgi:hypothetical protein